MTMDGVIMTSELPGMGRVTVVSESSPFSIDEGSRMSSLASSIMSFSFGRCLLFR